MADPAPGREKPAPEPAGNASRKVPARLGDFGRSAGSRLREAGVLQMAVLLLGIAAGVLMIMTEISTIASVDIKVATCKNFAEPNVRDVCDTKGAEAHHGVLLVLALFTFVMAWGASLGGSRPASIALVAAGAAVLVIALAIDLPNVGDTHGLTIRFADAKGKAGPGLRIEIVAGVLAIAAGAVRLAPEWWRRRAEED